MKRTLLVIVGSLARGGTETHLLTVLPRLLSRGYDVEVFLLSRRGALAEDMERGGFGLIAPWWPSGVGKSPLVVRSLRLVVVAVQLLAHLLFKRPRIVHFFLPASYIIGAPLAIISGIRTRIMIRRSLNHYQKKHSFSEGFERRLHQWMHVLLGNSRAVVRELVEQENAPPERRA